MKREFNRIVLFLGFLTAIVGLWITALKSPAFVGLDFSVIAVILAFSFVNASNCVLKIVGYSLCGVLGANGLRAMLQLIGGVEEYFSIGSFVMSLGMVIMSIAALIYLVVLILGFLGFVKKSANGRHAEDSCLWTELGRYKEMLEDGILTEEEFVELKQRAMEGSSNQSPSMDDLKKWKKLLDQQVINQEEFATIKKNIFSK